MATAGISSNLSAVMAVGDAKSSSSTDIRLTSDSSKPNYVKISAPVRQATGPGPTAVRGQQQDLNTPPSGRERFHSSLPSKQIEGMWGPHEGFMVPPIPAALGRTQPTPSASRSVGAELTGVAISIFGIECSNHWTGEYPNGHRLIMVNHCCQKTSARVKLSPQPALSWRW